MNLSDKKRTDIKTINFLYLFFIVSLSLIYSILVGGGLYGYGVDYTFGYTMGFDWSSGRAGLFDYLGFKIATLNINGYYISVYIVTFILSFSTGLLIKTHLNFHKSYSISFFLLIFILSIHTWPIVMSASNAMRQGLAMSFIFLALNACVQKKNYAMIFFLLVSIFMHRSSIFFMPIIIFANLLSKSTILSNSNKKSFFHFLIGSILLFFSNYFFSVLYPNGASTRIIGGDYRAAFVIIGCFFILMSFFNKKLLSNTYNLSLYYYSFLSLAPLLVGLNWQYERLGMMMTIPYILAYGFLFNKASYKLYICMSFILLFFLTIYTGMFAALIPLKEFNNIFHNR